MKTQDVLIIDKPSKGLLDLVRKLQQEKEAEEKEMKKNWNKFFPKKK
ncbi:hypothetical protein [Flavobacterium ustbae]|nr:hypothetical protein [Flavobacterium ustbae]